MIVVEPVSATMYLQQSEITNCTADVRAWLSAINRTNIAIHYVIAKGVCTCTSLTSRVARGMPIFLSVASRRHSYIFEMYFFYAVVYSK